MTIKIDHEGSEIEVYTAEERQADIDAALKAKEAEFNPIKTKLETELEETRKALGDRAGEFKQFRKLNDDVVAKLSIAERTIYENGLLLEESRKRNEQREKDAYDNLVNTTLKAKAGTDEKLLKKMQDTWAIIGIDARTPEDIEKKTNMVIGAIRQAEPDFIASLGGFGGGAIPPKPAGQGDGKSFADTDAGKAAAADLGLTLEIKK